MDFGTSTDHRVKIKEREKIDKYFDLAREQKKLWNMGDGVVGVVPKELERGWEKLETEGRIETIEITDLLRSAMRPDETWWHSGSQERSSVNACVKNSHGVK